MDAALDPSEQRYYDENGPRVATARSTYRAIYEWVGDDYWEVALVEDASVHGYGATPGEARANICGLLAVLRDPSRTQPEPEVDDFDLVDDVCLPQAALSIVARAKADRDGIRQLRGEAQAAREAVIATTTEAVAIMRTACRLLAEHADRVQADAHRASSSTELDLPDVVSGTIASAREVLEAVGQERTRSRAVQKRSAAATRRARASNREAAQLLVQQLGLTAAMGGEVLGLTPEQVERLIEP